MNWPKRVLGFILGDMKFNYQANSKSSGIYKILNTHTNRIYIGQAKSFQQRWYDHKRSLLSGNHQNKFFLNDYGKCFAELGHDDFLEFHVLEVMDGSSKEERNLKEEEWISKFWDRQQLCYNFKQKTEANERSCYSNTPEETKALLSKLATQKWSEPEFRLKIVNAMTGHKNTPMSAAHKAKIAQTRIGKPMLETTKVKISAAHKTERNRKKLKETYSTYREHIISRQKASVSKVHRLINQNGEIVEIINLNQWCKERGMHSSGFSNLLRKNSSLCTYRGWKYAGSYPIKQ